MATNPTAYAATLTWKSGEREALLEEPFQHPDFSFYIPPDKLADYRARASTMPHEEWLALLGQEGFPAIVAHAYGPQALVFEDIRRRLAKYPDQYIDVGLALARFGDEALPLVLAQSHRVDMWPEYAARRMVELGPVDAAEIALPVARLLRVKTLKVKKAAEAWLGRHVEATLAGLSSVLEQSAAARDVAATFAVLAKAGHGEAVRDLLDRSPAARENAAFAKAIGSARRAGTKKASKAARHRHVGWLYYRAHASSPLVIGDLDIMKDWRGSDGGEDELVELPKGDVLTCDLDLRAPDVFVSAAGDEVVLVAAESGGRSLREEYEDAVLLDEVARPLEEQFASFPLTISSGALAISIAYNATPAVGAKTAHLGDRYSEDMPRLPRSAPTTPIREDELLVLPFPNGPCEVVLGRSRMMKCVVRARPKSQQRKSR